jgi:sterol-4alpha-carboxylate 3-dehydrogenase (decarboxylating)
MSEQHSSLLGSVLVIGGCGLLGHHIVKKLLEANNTSKIIVLDVATANNRIAGVEYVTGSITSPEDVTNVLNDYTPRVIFHTVSPNPLSEDRKRFDQVNVKGTQNLLDCIRKHSSVKALIYTSSSSVVHNSYTDLVNVTEDLPLFFWPDQKAYYSHTKALAEVAILKANRTNGLLTTVIRPASLFGEGDHLLTGNMIGLGRKNLIIGGGNNVFDFTYAGNNAYAQVLAAETLIKASQSAEPIPEDMRVDGEAFVVTNDEPWKFWGFARALAIGSGFEVDETKTRHLPLALLVALVGFWECIFGLITFGTRQPSVTRRMIVPTTLERTFDISKAKKRLGYKPQVSIQEGINRATKWYVSQQNVDAKKSKFDAGLFHRTRPDQGPSAK